MARLPTVAGLGDRDFLRVFHDLMPEGEVWPRDDAAFQNKVLMTLMGTWRRLAARDGNLLVDSFPPLTRELLPEWELTLGLPDECTPLNPTVAQRVAAVAAKIVGRGGQSITYFIAVALALGFTITVQEFAPFRAGISHAGDPDYGEAWAHTWRIHAPATTVIYFRAGLSVAGDPLATWGNAQMQCVLSKIAPGQTIVQFAYP